MAITSNIHVGLAAWTNHTFTTGERCSNTGSIAYQCTSGGTSTSAPTGTGTGINNGGTAVFKSLSTVDYTTIQAWANGIPATLTQPVIGLIWNDSVETAVFGTILLTLTGHTTSSSNTITLQSAPGDGFIDKFLASPATALTYNNANGVSIEVPSGAGDAVVYLTVNDNFVNLFGIQIKGSNSNGGSLIGGSGSNLVVTRCIIRGISSATGSLFLFGGPTPTVTNCLIIDDGTTTAVPTVSATTFGGVVFANNTFIRTTFTSGAWGLDSGTNLTNASNFVTNNIFINYDIVYVAGGTGLPWLTKNNSYTNTGPFSGSWNGTDAGGSVYGITAAATFVGTTTDFHLKVGASSINAGFTDTADIPFAVDIFGTTRPQGTAWDIGAVELPASSGVGTITIATNVAAVGFAQARGVGTIGVAMNVAAVSAPGHSAAITIATNVAAVGRSTARSVGTITIGTAVNAVSSLLSIIGDITLNPIGEQPPEVPFDVSGTYELLPALQFADDASSVFTDIGLSNTTPIGVVTFDFTHPGMPSGTHVIQVSDLATGTSAAEGYFVDPNAVPGRGAFLANSPTSIQFIIPAYLYEQYRDDQDCQAFIDAYNGIAQTYLNWFNTINLPIYTGLSGPLLDWVAQGLYGIARPTIALTQTSGSGAFNTYKLDQIPIDGSTAATTSQVFIVTDEIFKRIITWLFYKGDGRQFSVTWLKRRIMRFLNGVAGTDPGVDQAYQVSVQFTGTTVVNIKISQGSAPTTYAPVLRAALLSGVIPLPFQFSYNVLLT